LAGRAEITIQAPEAGVETGARRNEMQIAMSNGLALMGWHNLRFLQDFGGRDFVWLLIGALLGIVVFWAISRRRRRWF
jgi:hypothetical protein